MRARHLAHSLFVIAALSLGTPAYSAHLAPNAQVYGDIGFRGDSGSSGERITDDGRNVAPRTTSQQSVVSPKGPSIDLRASLFASRTFTIIVAGSSITLSYYFTVFGPMSTTPVSAEAKGSASVAKADPLAKADPFRSPDGHAYALQSLFGLSLPETSQEVHQRTLDSSPFAGKETSARATGQTDDWPIYASVPVSAAYYLVVENPTASPRSSADPFNQVGDVANNNDDPIVSTFDRVPNSVPYTAPNIPPDTPHHVDGVPTVPLPASAPLLAFALLALCVAGVRLKGSTSLGSHEVVEHSRELPLL